MNSPTASSPRARRRWLALSLLLIVMLAALGVGTHYLRRAKAPALPPPPMVSLEGYDPEIAQAVEQARAAVLGAPHSAPAWGKLGSVFKVHRFHREAIACYAVAEQLDPQEPRWPYLHGMVLLDYDPDGAIPKLARGVELTPADQPAPRLQLAHLLIERGQLDEAERQVRTVLRAQPENPLVLVAAGKLELARGHLPEARAQLERAAQNPQTAKAAHVLLGTIYQRLGDAPAAEEAARKAAGLPLDAPAPDPFLNEVSALMVGKDAWLDRANRLLRSNKPREAIALLEQTVAQHPTDAAAWEMFGRGHFASKDFGAAEKALLRAVALSPASAEAHFQLGNAYFQNIRYAKAEAAFRRAAELRPDGPAHYNLGLTLAAEKKPDEAIEAFRAAIRYQPDFADAYKRLGGTLALAGRFEEALEPLRRAVELNRTDETARKMLERAELRWKERQ